MRIDLLELRLVRLPLVRFFETSFGRVVDRQFLLVRAVSDGITGWGEGVADEHPFYSSETTASSWDIVERYVGPWLLGVEFAHPRDVFGRLALVRGHQMAKAAVEMAAWDLYAKQQQRPLWQVLGGTGDPVPSGVSVGIQDSVDQLLDRIEEERAAGYRRVKIKIKPGWDVEVVDAVRRRFADLPLMVDANAAYGPLDTPRLRALDGQRLMMIEQPFDYDDIHEHARLQAGLSTPICLDESIGSVGRAAEALAAGACRVINIKPGRLGGHAESLRVHDVCAAGGVPVWHGGMLESGIGRAHNLHLSTLPNFRLPGDVAASRRYYQPDLIDPPIELGADGTIPVPGGAGIGVTVVEDRVAHATERVLTLHA